MDSNGLLPHAIGQPSTSCVPTDAAGESDAQQNAASLAADGSVTPLADRSAYQGHNHSLLPALVQPAAAPRLLVIEDDVPLARLLGSWLQSERFETELAHDGEQALSKIESGSYSLVLLDLNLPKIDGLTLLARLHAQLPELPILVLTGRNRLEDMVLTLDQGADDCLVKPFSLVELLARIRALLRRRANAAVELAPTVKAPTGLLLNRAEYRVERDGRRIELTPREFALLEFLMEHSPKPVSRATLMEQVWRVPFDPSTNIVDVYMKYLRDKIDCAGEQKLIRTVRGVGYALACA